MTTTRAAALRRCLSPLGASMLLATPVLADEPPCTEHWEHRGTGAVDGAAEGSAATLADGCPIYDQSWHSVAAEDDTRVVVIDKLADLDGAAADRRAVLYVIDTRTGEVSFRAAAAHGNGGPSDAPKRSKADKRTPEGSYEMLDIRRTRETVPTKGAEKRLNARKKLIGDWFVLLSYPTRDRTRANGADGDLGGAIGLHGGGGTATPFPNFPKPTAGCIRLFDDDLRRFLDAGLVGLPVRIVHRLDDSLQSDLWGCQRCRVGDVKQWLDLESVPAVPDLARAIAASPTGTERRSEPWTLEAVASPQVDTGRTADPGVQGVPGPEIPRVEPNTDGGIISAPDGGDTARGVLPPDPVATPVDQPTVATDPPAIAPSPNVQTPATVPVQPVDSEVPSQGPAIETVEPDGSAPLPQAQASAIAYPPLRHPAWGDPVNDALAGVGAARGAARRDGYDALMRRYWGPRPATPGADLPGQALRIYADPHCQIELSAPGGLRYNAGLTIHTVAYTSANCRLVWHHEGDVGGIARFVGYVRVP